jgi:hypothetical protein
LLGTDPFSDPAAPFVRGDVVRRGDELVATVRLRLAGGTVEARREFHGPAADCTPLTNAVALAVTLAVSSDEDEYRDEETEVAPVVPVVPERRAPSHVPRAALLGEALWTLGMLPRPTAGLGVEMRYAIAPRLALVLGGDWLPQASEAGLFSVGLSRAKIGLCVVPFRAASVSVLACSTGQGGATRVENEGATLPSAGSYPWFGVGLSARASAHIGGNWLVEGGAEAIAPTTRSVYATTSCPLVGFQEPPVTLSVFATTGMRF